MQTGIHRNSDGFLVSPQIDGSISAVVESDRLNDYIEYINFSKIKQIDIVKYFGYKLTNIDFIKDLDLSHIHIWDTEISSISPIYSEQLIDLRLTDIKTKDTVDFSLLPNLRKCSIDGKIKKTNLHKSPNLKSLHLWHFNTKGKNLSELPFVPNLESLSIDWGNFTSFSGLVRLPMLQKLELEYCTKLENIEGVEVLSKTLKFFAIHKSTKLSNAEHIITLPNLESLRLNSCGKLNSLNFLNMLNKLEDFRFVDTIVEDGDLSILLKHPSIKTVGFFNKKHYSHKDKEVEDYLNLRK